MLEIVNPAEKMIKIEYKTFNCDFLPEFLVYFMEENGFYKEGIIKLPDEKGLFQNEFNLDYKLSREHGIEKGEEPELIEFGVKKRKQIIKVNKDSVLDDVARIHAYFYLQKNEDVLIEHAAKMIEFGASFNSYNGGIN